MVVFIVMMTVMFIIMIVVLVAHRDLGMLMLVMGVIVVLFFMIVVTMIVRHGAVEAKRFFDSVVVLRHALRNLRTKSADFRCELLRGAELGFRFGERSARLAGGADRP